MRNLLPYLPGSLSQGLSDSPGTFKTRRRNKRASRTCFPAIALDERCLRDVHALPLGAERPRDGRDFFVHELVGEAEPGQPYLPRDGDILEERLTPDWRNGLCKHRLRGPERHVAENLRRKSTLL